MRREVLIWLLPVKISHHNHHFCVWNWWRRIVCIFSRKREGHSGRAADPMLTKSETVHGKHLWHQTLNLDLWSEAGCDVTPVAKYNEVALAEKLVLLADVAAVPSGKTDSHLRICVTIQMLLNTSLGESRKLNLYDVEIQLPTNQKWNVAPRREEGRRSCVGRYRPVVPGLGCVLFWYLHVLKSFHQIRISPSTYFPARV